MHPTGLVERIAGHPTDQFHLAFISGNGAKLTSLEPIEHLLLFVRHFVAHDYLLPGQLRVALRLGMMVCTMCTACHRGAPHDGGIARYASEGPSGVGDGRGLGGAAGRVLNHRSGKWNLDIFPPDHFRSRGAG